MLTSSHSKTGSLSSLVSLTRILYVLSLQLQKNSDILRFYLACTAGSKHGRVVIFLCIHFLETYLHVRIAVGSISSSIGCKRSPSPWKANSRTWSLRPRRTSRLSGVSSIMGWGYLSFIQRRLIQTLDRRPHAAITRPCTLRQRRYWQTLYTLVVSVRSWV